MSTNSSMTSSLTLVAGQIIKSIFFPSSWSIELIQPELHVFRRKKIELVLNHHVTAERGVALMVEQELLTDCTRVVYVTHGFHNTVATPWVPDLKDALLENADQLVILVSWGNGSSLPLMYYLQAAANIQSVSDWLSHYMIEIKRRRPDLVQYAIGHSLGGHLFGLAGRKSEALKRISALDPAGPAFEHGEFTRLRLAPTDASDMVDVIHTDGFQSKLDPADWFAPVNHYGTLVPLGTVDFYPNFGFGQPGSGSFELAGSHLRSIEYFIYSISNPTKFKTIVKLAEAPYLEHPVCKTVVAESEAQMGYYADRGAARAGLYYIETKSCYPWDIEGSIDNGEGEDGTDTWCTVM